MNTTQKLGAILVASLMLFGVAPPIAATNAASVSAQQRLQARKAARKNNVGIRRSSSSSSRSSQATMKQYAQCTEKAWNCSEISACEKGFIKRKCSRVDLYCLHPEAVQPPTLEPCTPVSSSSSPKADPTRDRMKANMDAWTEARKELTSKMDNMSHQPYGRNCFSTLAQIDADWVQNYNNYVSIYTNLDSGNWLPAMQTAERQMADVLERIRKAPTFCY